MGGKSRITARDSAPEELLTSDIERPLPSLVNLAFWGSQGMSQSSRKLAAARPATAAATATRRRAVLILTIWPGFLLVQRRTTVPQLRS